MPFSRDPESIIETDLAIERARTANPQIPAAVWDGIQALAHQVGAIRHQMRDNTQAIQGIQYRLYGFPENGHDVGDIEQLRHGQQQVLRLGWAIFSLLLTGLITLVVILVNSHR